MKTGLTIIGIKPGSTLTISGGGDRKEYSAPIEKVARWHQKVHPTGKRKRKLLANSEEMRKR